MVSPNYSTRVPRIQCHTLKGSAGFTIVEFLVAVAVFSVVMTIGVGSLLAVFDAYRRIQAASVLLNNLNFTVESTVRNVRTGFDYHCGAGDYSTPRDCPSGDTVLAFMSTNGMTSGQRVVFRLDAVRGVLERSTDGGASFFDMTGAGVTVTDLAFFVNGAAQSGGASDGRQPTVRIALSGLVSDGKFSTDFFIQSLVTQRMLDL